MTVARHYISPIEDGQVPFCTCVVLASGRGTSHLLLWGVGRLCNRYVVRFVIYEPHCGECYYLRRMEDNNIMVWCQSLFAGTTCDVVSEGKHEEEGCQLLDVSTLLHSYVYGTNSTYEHSHMPKINSSSVKICESSRPRLARVSPKNSQLLPAP